MSERGPEERRFTGQDVVGLLTRFYNVDDHGAEEVVRRWPETDAERAERAAEDARELSEGSLEVSQRLVARNLSATGLSSDRPVAPGMELTAVIAQLAVAEELRALRECLPGALLEALGDSSHLDKLVRAVRELDGTLSSGDR